MLKKAIESKPVLIMMFITLALLWGLSFIFTKDSMQYLKPIEVLSLRWLVAVIFFTILMVAKVVRIEYKNKPVKKLIPLVLCQPIIYSLLETLGVNRATASEAAVIIAALPFMVLLLGVIIYKEHPEKKAIFGMFVGFSGVVVTIAFGPFFSLEGNLIGYFFLFAAITVGACYSLQASKLSDEFSPFEITFAMTISGAVAYNLANAMMGNFLHTYSIYFQIPSLVLSSLFLGAGCSCLGFIICNYILTRMNPPIATAVQCNAINLVGVIAGILINGDPWGWYTIVGVALMTLGIIYVSLHTAKQSCQLDETV